MYERHNESLHYAFYFIYMCVDSFTSCTNELLLVKVRRREIKRGNLLFLSSTATCWRNPEILLKIAGIYPYIHTSVTYPLLIPLDEFLLLNCQPHYQFDHFYKSYWTFSVFRDTLSSHKSLKGLCSNS